MKRNSILLLALVLFVGCTDSSSTSTVTMDGIKPVAFNPTAAPTVEFTVPDMMCPEGCGAKVKEILSQQPGAKDVLVDFPNKTAIVAVDKDTFDPKQAVAALKDHQFKNSAAKGGSAVDAVTTTVDGAAK